MNVKKYTAKTRRLKTIAYGLVFSFMLSSLLSSLSLLFNTASADELIENAFMPAKAQETIIDLGNTKDAVGNEILRQSVGVQTDLGQGCFVQGQKIDGNQVKKQMCETKYNGIYHGAVGANADSCSLPDGSTKTISNSDKQDYCSTVLGGNRDVSPTTSQAPLIVRITKFLLRITIVLSITMVIYSGIMYIIEASKGAEVKETTDNLMYIIGGVLLALMSLGLINLISSLSISSIGGQTNGSQQISIDCSSFQWTDVDPTIWGKNFDITTQQGRKNTNPGTRDMSKLDPTMIDWSAFGTKSVCAVGDLLKKIDPTMRDRSKVDPTMKSNRSKLDPTNTKLRKKIF